MATTAVAHHGQPDTTAANQWVVPVVVAAWVVVVLSGLLVIGLA